MNIDIADDKLLSRKKPTFAINQPLQAYLKKYNRESKISVSYDDLLRFQGAVTVYDKNDDDTLWVRCYYPDHEREHIDRDLKHIYDILHSDGRDQSLEFLSVDAVDYCTFGNTKPFRIKIRNILNDGHTYFYVKKADSSRVYGLELEHLLSPHRINFLVSNDTLIEEHIAGIPGDEFIEDYLEACDHQERTQIAKEFVKFNERCLIRLLGDMRAYNYVIIPTHDFDRVSYAIRAIDFDQQCYEGRMKVYRPQFFKENVPMVMNVADCLKNESIEQYKKEERALIAKRLINTQSRYKALIKCMRADNISETAKLKQLKRELHNYTGDIKFKTCRTMGSVLNTALEFIRRNYSAE
ncbi:hypothetical protein [Nonlabens ponticola]|uniref:Uncharacterized protein n=1 Tax=Nonlabens ponticola TaxID=2496866 RepID=A0A3S9MZU4_9FLAO|nr:hypothetical protein [Nonlabens ponticola]AZQ44593.1 hypothetical protein EJ995_10185 [Nonlabens ponticola]